ncbi:hypothetical protein FLX56_26230, partial [Synechococcus moorigangaii CMS01]|nr:hypothetical protein [Synechococcus moorigangaii CMS01]
MGQLEKEFRKEALVFIDQPTLDQIKNLAEQVGQSTSKNSSGKPTYVANRKSGVQLTTSNYDEFIEFICNDGKQLKEIKISSGNFGSTYFKICLLYTSPSPRDSTSS